MNRLQIKRVLTLSVAIVLVLSGIYLISTFNKPVSVPPPSLTTRPTNLNAGPIREVYLAGGCFWGVEEYLSRIDGIVDAVAGYANGKTENPKYEDLLYRNSGHAETVKVRYDTSKISLDEVLIYYFNIIDPTSLNKQGNDIGTQYRTGVYFVDPEDEAVVVHRIREVQKANKKPVVVEAEMLRQFFDAEDYHQDYLKKNPTGYCHIDLDKADEPVIRISQYPRPSDEAIRKALTAGQFHVTQENGTEPPFANVYNDHFEQGIYVDVVTGEPLYSSKDKFHSGTGWPSFTRPIVSYVINTLSDTSQGMTRTEVRSRSGDAHLGHVFTDGPVDKGGLRYCMNSAALRFVPLAEMDAQGYGPLVKWVK